MRLGLCVVIWHTALSMELNQLVIARGAELHYEGSASPPTEQGTNDVQPERDEGSFSEEYATANSVSTTIKLISCIFVDEMSW